MRVECFVRRLCFVSKAYFALVPVRRSVSQDIVTLCVGSLSTVLEFVSPTRCLVANQPAVPMPFVSTRKYRSHTKSKNAGQKTDLTLIIYRKKADLRSEIGASRSAGIQPVSHQGMDLVHPSLECCVSPTHYLVEHIMYVEGSQELRDGRAKLDSRGNDALGKDTPYRHGGTSAPRGPRGHPLDERKIEYFFVSSPSPRARTRADVSSWGCREIAIAHALKRKNAALLITGSGIW